jgi:outer membrane protein TolC
MTRSKLTCALLLGALWASPAFAQVPAPAVAAPTATAPAAPAATTTAGKDTGAQSAGVDDALGDAGLKRFFEFADFQNGLTSKQVAQRAVANSAAVEQRQASARAAEAQEDEATSRLWPKLTLSARYTRLSPVDNSLGGGGGSLVGTTAQPDPVTGQLPANAPLFPYNVNFPNPENQYELKAALSVPVSDYLYRTNVAIEAAEHSSDAARYNEEATKLDVAANARLAYYDWVRALGQQIVAEEALANFRAREKDAKVFYEAGTLPKAQMLGSQAQTKNAEVLATRAQHFTKIAEERLRTITYDPNPKATYKVGEDLRSAPAPMPQVLDTSALVSEAQGKRAEFKALKQQEQALEGLASLARSENYPRLDVNANYIYGNPNQRYFPLKEEWNPSWDVSAVLSWTPTDTARANAVTAQQEAKIAEVRAQRRMLVENLRLEVTQAVQGVEEADATLGSAREALAAAEESYRGRRELFRIGQGSLVDLNDAEVALTRARLEVINAHIDARTSRVRLEHALGRDTVPQQP